MAKAIGCHVLATATNERHVDFLTGLGTSKVYVDNGTNLYTEVMADFPGGVNAILELVGPKTLRESLQMVCKNGIVCHTGILEGEYVLQDFDPIKEIPNGVYLSGFFSNYPTQEVMDESIEERLQCTSVF